jgi:hypothetical protein
MLLKMLEVPREKVMAHPITPFIDYYMLQLTEEAGVQHASFPDGYSGGTADSNAIRMIVDAISGRNKIFLHSIKTQHAWRPCVEARERKVRRKKVRTVFNPKTRLFEQFIPPL